MIQFVKPEVLYFVILFDEVPFYDYYYTPSVYSWSCFIDLSGRLFFFWSCALVAVIFLRMIKLRLVARICVCFLVFVESFEFGARN